MLNRLRRRLALLCTGMTFAVFVTMIILIGVVSEQQYRAANETLFRGVVDDVLEKLERERIKNSWLGEMEISNSCIIAIENNGQPLYFPGVWTSPTSRKQLLKQARDYASLQMGVDYQSPVLSLERVEFLLAQGNAQYRCAVVLSPQEENWISLTLLSDMENENRTVWERRMAYGGISLAVLVVLSLFSWWFTGEAVKPIKENMEKQREFVACASHELRSPLATIKSSVAAIQAEPTVGERLLVRIDRASGQMNRLVEDMLILANSDRQSWQMQPVPVEIDVLLIETVEACRDEAWEQGFHLELDLPEEVLPPILGDTQRLEQVLMVLIDNSVSHAGIPSTITVKAYVQNKLIIQVIDHGVGIAPEIRERVFERFFCADLSRTEKRHFGLGLSIAWELTVQHHGRIDVSETPGGGCTFQLSFPIQSTVYADPFVLR